MGETEAHRIMTSHDPVKMALAALANDRKSGTVVVGPVGSGKTFTVRAVLEEMSIAAKMSSRLRVVRAPSCRRSDVSSILDRLRPDDLSREQRSAAVIAADDLDTWEPAALTLLADALDQGSVRLLGAVRTAAVSGVMSLLRPAKPTALTKLEPWRLSDFSRYARTLLDASLHVATTQTLLKFAGGNPLCLAELLDHGRAVKKLHRRYETWVWSGPVEVPPVTLAREWQQLQRQPEEVRDVLATLSLAGPMALSVLQRIHSLSALEEAECQGLIRVTVLRTGAIDVALSRPIEGHVVVRKQATLRGRVLGTRYMDGTSTESGLATTYARAGARVALQYGLPLPQPLTLTAAAAAVEAHDNELAHELLIHQHQWEGVQLRAATLTGECRFKEAADILTQWLAEGGATEDYAETAARRDSLLRAATTRVPEGSVAFRTVNVTARTSTYTICANSWLGVELEGSLVAGEAALGDATRSASEHERSLVATLFLYAQLGLIERAVGTAGSVDWITRQDSAPTNRLALPAVLGICHLVRGSLRDAQIVSSSLSRVAVEETWPFAFAIGAFIDGRCALMQGRSSLALRRLSESLASFEIATPLLNRTVLLESLALGYSLQGRFAEAAAAHRQADHETSPCAPRLLKALARLTHAEVLHIQGDRRQALEAATAVVEELPSDARLARLLGLHLIVRIQGSSQVTQSIREVANDSDFSLAQTYASHAKAAEAQDAESLEHIAQTYEDAGLRWLAAETAASALASRRPGQSSAQTAFRLRRLVNQLNEEDHVKLPSWWGSAADLITPLTAREKQIAAAAANGYTAAHIAAELGLSKRTVENHIQHVYRKFGVSSREELGKCLPSTPQRLTRVRVDGAST